MTAVYATREPLQTLGMATTQRRVVDGGYGSTGRRHSARLMEKEDMGPPPTTNGYYAQPITGASIRGNTANGVKGRQMESRAPVTKRKAADYDEEDDGFQFTRSKSRRTKKAADEPVPVPVNAETTDHNRKTKRAVAAASDEKFENEVEQTKKKGRRKRISFSTPNGAEKKDERPRRRSKRLSNEADKGPVDSRPPETKAIATTTAKERPLSVAKRPKVLPREETVEQDSVLDKDKIPDHEAHSATKISLPFADTPVIRRNKEMRQKNTGRDGERRSSLGMRGRRASSLIESGNSNALPHNEVEPPDFYKHIESEGLSEPRRMRQLLTWCATRAMDQKPSGLNHGRGSEILAARVIQEELLKDFSSKSEMSDWFSREDVPPPELPIVKKPNPKNVQNASKIEELEEQIRQLQLQLSSLQSLSKTQPPLPSLTQPTDVSPTMIDSTLLDQDQQSLLQSLLLNPSPESRVQNIEERLDTVTRSIEPTVDRFADGVQGLNVFRGLADRVAGRVLGTVAEGLERRLDLGKKKEEDWGEEMERKGKEKEKEKEDVRGVLRALSRVDR